MSSIDFDVGRFFETARATIPPAAKHIKSVLYDSFGTPVTYRTKPDKTLVSELVDKSSENISREIIMGMLPQYMLIQEESGKHGEDSDIILYHDPFDGTRGALWAGLLQR